MDDEFCMHQGTQRPRGKDQQGMKEGKGQR